MQKFALTWFLGLSYCFAQADRAALTGTITDATRAGVPSAHVRIVYPETGLSRVTVASGSGVFRLSGLPLGACHVEVSAAGFRSVKMDSVALTVGETRELD